LICVPYSVNTHNRFMLFSASYAKKVGKMKVLWCIEAV
jgi:hypothetical protein